MPTRRLFSKSRLCCTTFLDRKMVSKVCTRLYLGAEKFESLGFGSLTDRQTLTISEFSDQRKLLEVVKVCKKRVVGGIASLSLEWRAIDPDLQVCSLNTFFSCLVFLNSWCPEVEVICSSCISVAQGVSRLFFWTFLRNCHQLKLAKP